MDNQLNVELLDVTSPTPVAGDVSKAPARLAASTRTPRDDREGANTPTVVDLRRGSSGRRLLYRERVRIYKRIPQRGPYSSAIDILGEGEGAGDSDREPSGLELGMERGERQSRGPAREHEAEEEKGRRARREERGGRWRGEGDREREPNGCSRRWE